MPTFTQQKKITAHRVIITSFAVDLLDILLNFSVVLLTGSVIMVTELLEGFSDFAASGLLLIGIRRSMHKEDKTHPFGYGREIYFWTLLSSVIMFGFTASLSFFLGWQRFFSPQPVHDPLLAFVVLVITFFSNAYAFMVSYKRLLRKRSVMQIVQIFYRSSLIETKTTFILDLMGTVSALVGMLALGIYLVGHDPRFDGLGAMTIGVALAISSIFLIAGIRDLLVGRSASVETETKITGAALAIPEVEQVLDIKTLHIGSERLLVNLDIHMRPKLTTREIEHLIERIKERIQHEVPSVKYLQVELDTP